MDTYEEFLENHSLEDLKSIEFLMPDEKSSLIWNVSISDDLDKYIDLPSKAPNLNTIAISENGNQDYYKFIRNFVKNCNEDVRMNYSMIYGMSGKEFLQGEEIIESIIKEMDDKWTKKQKVSYVHYKMGELISYYPDFVFDGKEFNTALNKRSMWKSLTKGLNVCNGITSIEKNILKRIGVDSRVLSSGTHAFLLSEVEGGNLISDATWDLSSSLYQGKPQYFGLTYKELREKEKGISESHRLENPPENVVKIDDKELRDIYKSIGITDENGNFKMPIYHEIQKINSRTWENNQEKLNAFLKMFTEKFPKEATHLSETREILEYSMITLGIDKNLVNTRFVYNKDDKNNQKKILALHIGEKELENTMHILNLETMNFDKIELREFDKQYRTHTLDTTTPFWKKYIKENELEEDVDKDREE